MMRVLMKEEGMGENGIDALAAAAS